MKKIFFVLLFCFVLLNIVSPDEVAAEDSYALSYHVATYSSQTDTSGNTFAYIDGKKYSYSEQWNGQGFLVDLLALENQNVLYELHNDEIVATYTMADVLMPKVVMEPSIEDGLTYQNGKFSTKDFDLVISVSNELQSEFKKNDLLYFLNSKEEERLQLSIKKLHIEPADSVNFGSSGWWLWKEYQNEITDDINDKINIGTTKEYKYKVNLEDKNALTGLQEYNINFNATLTFDIGTSKKGNARIKVGNLDYQEAQTEERKKTSDSGQVLTEASTKLNGLKTAIQFSGHYFTKGQTDQINEFVNLWISELILAKYVDKSSLEEKITEKIANEWLKKLGLNTSVLTIPGEIRATTFLETETQDGEKVFIQFDIKLIDFNFGNSGMPTMAVGSGAATVYSKEGEDLDSSIILPAYANVCAFCEQLQKVAKDTIFDGSKKYLGIFGVSADSTAEALSSQMMTKLLNNKYTKDVFKMIDAKEMKSALKTVSSKALSYGTKKIYKLITKPSKKRTEVSIKCPVDIKVYDNDGKLCGIISNNEVDNTYSDIYMAVVGDQKNIYLVGDDYTFELTGTDVGTMDYYVKEFDENGIEIRKISYENIALNNGSKYYSYVPEGENLSSILFDLTDVDGNGISPTYGADKDYEEEKTEMIANGVCGENLTWSLDRDGVLQIKGTGDMYDYENYEEPLNPTPWKSYRIKSVLVGDGVTSIGNDAFYDCRSLCHVDISDTVTHIGSYAFALCYSLKSVVIPDSVNFLGKSAFFTNNIVQGLKRIVMQGSAPIVEDDAFGYVFAELVIPPNTSGYDKKPWVQMAICSEGQTYGKCGDGLTWKLDEDGVLTVEGSGSMYYYYYSSPGVGSYQAQLPPWDIISKQVKEIVFNAENSQIGSYAFYSCKTVTEVSIGYGVTSIGDNAFSYCNSLERINIPEGITSINRYAFGWCSSLKTVNIPESAINIESGAFCGCSSLESINLPKGVEDIESYIFNDCSSLKTVNIPEGVTYIKNSAFYGCSNLKNIIIPRGVKGIWKEAFCNCSNLFKVTMPPSVTAISEYAFHSYDSSGYSPLKNLTIYCAADSYAETYAKENGFPYVYENISDDDIQGTDLL